MNSTERKKQATERMRRGMMPEVTDARAAMIERRRKKRSRRGDEKTEDKPKLKGKTNSKKSDDGLAALAKRRASDKPSTADEKDAGTEKKGKKELPAFMRRKKGRK